jgi:hypothetical protein
VVRRAYFSAGRRTEIARYVAEPLCERFRLPPQTDPDLLLCALYHRVFVHETDVPPARGGSPFGKMGTGSEPVGGPKGDSPVVSTMLRMVPEKTGTVPNEYAVQETPSGPPLPAVPTAWRRSDQ